MSGVHVESQVIEFVVDEVRKVLSTPAYMLAGNMLETYCWIQK